MRIFTLGRNGIPLFLFALILFSGTFSTYGQTTGCPTVDDSTQIFCDSGSYQVSDLVANEENVLWYAEADSTTPLRATDLLVDGEDYYADFEGGNCDARPSVTVTVEVAPDAPEILGIKPIQAQAALKQSVTSLAFCVDDVNNSGITLDDINVDAEFAIQWYASQTSTEVLPLTTELQNGAIYWVDQGNSTCRSDRRSVTVVLNSEDIPTGPATQQFCAFDNPTLGSIDASGNNRYYNTETGSSPLNENTRLAVGTTTYYVSTYNAQTNCESTERLEVTVTVIPLTVNEESQSFCESLSEGNNLSGATVAHLSPEGGVWYADQSFSAPLAPETLLEDGEDYFLQVENCATTKVNVTVYDAPNAGTTSDLTYCINAGVIDIHPDIVPSTVLGTPDRGTINHDVFGGDLTFDPAELGVGTYNLIHTVSAPEGSTCEDDTARITITILDALNAGSDVNETVCSAAFDDLNALAVEFAPLLAGRDQGGVFTDGAFQTSDPMALFGAWFAQYESGDRDVFTATYTVTHENGCPDSAEISVTVEDTPVVGPNGTIPLENNVENTTSLAEALTDEPTGGVWTNEADAVVEGTLVPQEPGVFTYTVTVGECSASATVTVEAAQPVCPVITDTFQEFCESIGEGDDSHRPMISDLTPADAVWYASATSDEALAADFVLEDGGVYFAGNAEGTCEARESVTVGLFPTPNAGALTNVSFCSNEEAVNLVDYINESILGAPQQTGTFSPNLEGNMFDPADYEPGKTYEFSYTVEGNEDCPTDETTVKVTVNAAPNAGEDIAEEFCLTSETLPTAEELLAMYGDDTRDQNGIFNPTLEELASAYATEPFGTFTTTYTVKSGTCTDTASLSVTIEEQVPANAGGNVTPEVCSTAGVQNLSDLLGPDAVLGGEFSAPYEDGTFDPSTAGAEPVVITYTVNEENACVTGEDSATLTITVVDGPNPGENGSITLAMTAEPVNLFDSLGGTPDEGGIWTPGNENGDLDPADFVPGTYSYTYTVANDNCEASATVTVTITGEVICPEITQTEQAFCESILTGNDSRLPVVSDLLPTGATWYASADATEALPANTPLVSGTVYFAGNAEGTCDARESVTVTLDDSPNAGATTPLTFCEGGEAVDLLTLIKPSILGAPDAGGTISPALASGTTIFDPAVDLAGTYTYTVESTNDACSADEAKITITITPAANAGGPLTLNFCADAGLQDLFSFLPEGVSTDGTFEGFEDGVFDPAVDAPGEYTYTVEQTGTCEGTSTAVVTINVSEAPAAPTAAAQSFCISEGATVADLVAGEEGDALLWYTDAELQTLADEADALVAGSYYVTVTNEGECESAATEVAVTLTDAATPTLAQGGNVFCEFDNPTIATLEANVDAAGTITWYDAATGGNVVATSELLEDGVTYYAASTDATSACESSVRLSVTVDLGECPVVIPEAFSPNNDGVNDTFEITYIAEEFPNYTIEIYNRWGNIVFKGNASTPNWDGVSTESRSLGDSVLPVGVYFYIVNFNDGQTAPTQGRLYLSR